MFGISLEPYPRLNAWTDRLSQRESFRQTAPTPEQVQAELPTIKKILGQRFITMFAGWSEFEHISPGIVWIRLIFHQIPCSLIDRL